MLASFPCDTRAIPFTADPQDLPRRPHSLSIPFNRSSIPFTTFYDLIWFVTAVSATSP